MGCRILSSKGLVVVPGARPASRGLGDKQCKSEQSPGLASFFCVSRINAV